MSGRYCEKHEEWAPDGECRWCEPTQSVGGGSLPGPSDVLPLLFSWRSWPSVAPPTSGAKLQQMMNDLWVKLVREDKKP